MSNYRYLPQTDQDIKEMLSTIGVHDIEELFADIPESIRFKGQMSLEAGKDETSLMREMTRLSDKNTHIKSIPSFLGAGVYEHYIPTIVQHLLLRSEFYTAYTPYQPEISQGELQAIFEFQSMICELTQMDVANSSMYDGPTALAEAAMMSGGVTKKNKILVSAGVHPEAIEVIKTSAKGQGMEVIEVPLKDNVTDLAELKEAYSNETACVLVQYPNFFGHVEDLEEIEKIAHQEKALYIVSANPLSLGVLEAPGNFGADVVVGDAQPFGIPTQFGGPHCGYFAVTNKLMRKVPGRLVGETTDEHGQRGYVLTLQAREQHIRRDKATSNICSNQALNALAAAISMASLGRQGLVEIASQNLQKAHYAKSVFKKSGFDLVGESPTFNEFVVKLKGNAKKIEKELVKHNFIGGLPLSHFYAERENEMLVAVTEMRTKEEIDGFVRVLEELA